MHRLFTPLLRRVYALAGTFAVLYLAFVGAQYSSWNKERLFRKLTSGTEAQRDSAAFDLAYLNGEEQLLRALKSRSRDVRSVAASSLWDLWVRAGGHRPFRQIQAANRAISRHAYDEALRILTEVTRAYPDFPEGWNRRATVYWQLGEFQRSADDARRAVVLNPNHFGAWQGLSMCQVQLGNLEEAIRCLHAAIRIAPHEPELRRHLRRCEELLDALSPGERRRYDEV